MINCAILIPVRDALPWLEDCLKSALAQPVRFILIQDDGSEDGGDLVIRRYAAKDPRIVAAFGDRRGVIATRNDLAQRAIGLGVDWIQYLDADDLLLKGKVERQIAQSDGLSEVLWCDTAVKNYRTNPPGRQIWLHHDPRDTWLPPLPGTWLLRRSFFDRGIWWRPEFESGYNDLAFWLDVVRAEVPRQRTPFVGFLHRKEWSLKAISKRAGRSRAPIVAAYPEFAGNPRGTEIKAMKRMGPTEITTATSPYMRRSPSSNAEWVLICPEVTGDHEWNIAYGRHFVLGELAKLRESDCLVTILWPWAGAGAVFTERITQVRTVMRTDPLDYDRVIRPPR